MKAYYERKDMVALSWEELHEGFDRSQAEEKALADSPDWPRGSVRLTIQSQNFVAEMMSRVVFQDIWAGYNDWPLGHPAALGR